MFKGTNTPSTNEDDSHWEIGKNYFLRTVTHHVTGKLEKVTSKELVLSNGAWIADDGNFTEAMKANTFLEVEMFDPAEKVIVGRGSLIDAQQIHTLPTSRK